MREWLFITYRAPREPSAVRVSAWRALRGLGATALGTSLYCLPARYELILALERIASRLEEGGGEATILRGVALGGMREDALLGRFAAARAEEYAQVLKSARKFIEHVNREENTHDFRFAEVESLAEEFEKVRRQFERVVRRDYFESPDRAAAGAVLVGAEERLTTYVSAAAADEA